MHSHKIANTIFVPLKCSLSNPRWPCMIDSRFSAEFAGIELWLDTMQQQNFYTKIFVKLSLKALLLKL